VPDKVCAVNARSGHMICHSHCPTAEGDQDMHHGFSIYKIVWSYLLTWRGALGIVKPETLIGWHRKGFRLFWKWKSKGGRPRLPGIIRRLMIEMARENPTWSEERVANEVLLKLALRGPFGPTGLRTPPDPVPASQVSRDGAPSSVTTPRRSSPATFW
jgi:hypothetical protein